MLGLLARCQYGCEWVRLETSQLAIERKMLNVELRDRVRKANTGQRTRVTDIVQYVTNAKWNGLDTSPE